MPRKGANIRYLDKGKKQREDWSKKYKGAEIKRLTTNIAGVLNSENATTNDGACTGIFLSNVSAGAAVSNRVGNQIRPLGLKGTISMTLVQPAALPLAANAQTQTVANITPTTLTHTAVIVLDRQSNGINIASLPATEAFFRSIFTTSPGSGQLVINYDNKERFDIVWQKSVILHNVWQPTKLMRYNIPLDLFDITYGASITPPVPITNSLILFIYSGGDAPFTPGFTQTADQMYLSKVAAFNELYFVDL